jgi:hypothetical protein
MVYGKIKTMPLREKKETLKLPSANYIILYYIILRRVGISDYCASISD